MHTIDAHGLSIVATKSTIVTSVARAVFYLDERSGIPKAEDTT